VETNFKVLQIKWIYPTISEIENCYSSHNCLVFSTQGFLVAIICSEKSAVDNLLFVLLV